MEAIYLATEYEPQLNVSAASVHANTVWGRGITGSGIKVAVVEAERAAHANLDVWQAYSSSAPVGDHATHVAGIVASTYGTYRGVADGATLLSCNAGSLAEAGLIDTVEWAIGKVPSPAPELVVLETPDEQAWILNHSYGSNSSGVLTLMARYLDHVTYYDRRLNVVAAGNTPYDPVKSPGTAYNVLTVGAYDDRNTVTWTDDAMAGNSCWQDAWTWRNGNHYTGSPKRNKREVVAPGVSVVSTSSSGGFTVYPATGPTSFAAPHVSGLAALLVQRDAALRGQPEALKAVIMASAVHDVEPGDCNPNTQTDNKDGVGGIDAALADDIARFRQWNAVWIPNGSDTWYNNERVDYIRTSYPSGPARQIQQGERVRVVLVWPSKTANPQSHTAYTLACDDLYSNLDLYIRQPDGTDLSLASTSVYNNL